MTINNNNIFGAFTLNEARGSRLTGDWLNKESVANYGWFGGGATPTTVATVDRIDFSNDTATATARGSLSAARQGLTATGNSNYGWFGGGGFPRISTVDRIDFSNDAATASPRGPLSLARLKLAATGNSNYGWFGGGYNPPSPFIRFSTVDRIDFSNDAATALARGPLTSARYGVAATGNSNYGWFGGGNNPQTTTVDRIDFSNDSSTASPRGPLLSPGGRSNSAATGNSNYGWFGGGFSNGFDVISTVDRIDFSNDSATASPRGLLLSPGGRAALAATGNSNYGWFGGGQPGIGKTTVERIDFSNDLATASPRGPLPLSSARYQLAATSGVLNIRRQKAGNYGWFGGGQNPGATPTTVATVDRIDFSNDLATASPRGPLFTARQSLAATGNSNYGWFGGGINPAATPTTVSTVDRIDFSNDSATASPRGPLSSLRNGGAATGNSNYGWWGAGFAPSISTVERIDFSNDSAGGSFRCILNLGGSLVSRLTATSNSNYGWFGGGFVPAATSAINRIDFSNDSATISVRNPLSGVRVFLSATGNSNYGWFGGGQNISAIAIVDRIDFSNDLSSVSPRGSLSSPRQLLAATSNTNK